MTLTQNLMVIVPIIVALISVLPLLQKRSARITKEQRIRELKAMKRLVLDNLTWSYIEQEHCELSLLHSNISNRNKVRAQVQLEHGMKLSPRSARSDLNTLLEKINSKLDALEK